LEVEVLGIVVCAGDASVHGGMESRDHPSATLKAGGDVEERQTIQLTISKPGLRSDRIVSGSCLWITPAGLNHFRMHKEASAFVSQNPYFKLGGSPRDNPRVSGEGFSKPVDEHVRDGLFCQRDKLL
jgi:hypothetical protein